jgi:hypothetical protein
MIFEGSRAAAAQPGRPHKTMVYPTEQGGLADVHVLRVASGVLELELDDACIVVLVASNAMTDDFAPVFSALKPVLAKYEGRLAVKVDTSTEYTLVTKCPSPFPQHKGQPMFFGSVKLGKAYASYHLMPIYMCPVLEKSISPPLKKRMQGKSCFNFKDVPAVELMDDLARLTEASFVEWREKKWA